MNKPPSLPDRTEYISNIMQQMKDNNTAMAVQTSGRKGVIRVITFGNEYFQVTHGSTIINVGDYKQFQLDFNKRVELGIDGSSDVDLDSPQDIINKLAFGLVGAMSNMLEYSWMTVEEYNKYRNNDLYSLIFNT